MNFTYFRFLFVTTIKKRPVWITLLLMLLTCSVFILILPAVSRMNTLQVWANTTMAACESFLGMTIAILAAVLAVHIFQDGIAEGTELIVVSKPIKRYKIILTKYLVFGLFCLLANLLTLLLTVFTIFLPSTEVKFYWGLIVSMFIGNSVMFLFFGCIAIILTVKVQKTGVIVVNVLISLVLIIYQMLTLLVFDIPARSLVQHGVLTPTYIVRDQKDDGSYKETEVVKFGLTEANLLLPESQQFDFFNKANWKGIKEYYEGEILGKDPTLALNITDVAGQLALSYLTVGIDNYSYRQASRQLNISRFYKYTLTSPASPEIVRGTEGITKKTLDWVYTDERTVTLYDVLGDAYKIIVPAGIGFAGIKPTSGNRLKGFGDKIPVGVYMPAGRIITATDVFFEKEDYEKYKDKFSKMYDYVFDYSQTHGETNYDLEGLKPYMYSSAWASSNANQSLYYQRVFDFLMGKVPQYSQWDNTSFNISTVQELNERFIQFKYYSYMRALEEQKAMFINGPTTAEEKAALQTALESKEVKNSYAFYAVKHIKNADTGNDTFLMERDSDSVSLTPLLTDDVNTPDINLLKATCLNLTDEQQETSSYAKYNMVSTIFKKCANQKEDYLFSSLTDPTGKRSAEFTGRSYAVDDYWYSNLDFEMIVSSKGDIKLFHRDNNMKYFYYSTEPRIAYWVYAVIWTTISMAVLAGSFIIYLKYDFH